MIHTITTLGEVKRWALYAVQSWEDPEMWMAIRAMYIRLEIKIKQIKMKKMK